MLASHAALCLFTGSREMFVFQTLLAGNAGQFGAPGTVVPASRMAGPDDCGAVVDPAAAVIVPFVLAAPAAADPAAHPAAHPKAATAMAVRRRTRLDAKCPLSLVTVASWHGYSGRSGKPGIFSASGASLAAAKRTEAGRRAAAVLYSCLSWRHALCAT
jgi:hypothetical protein